MRAAKPNYELLEGDMWRFKIEIDIAGAERGKTTLLATPVFDDVTIFHSEGVRIIAYELSSS